MRNCHSTRSSPVTASVTGCSTCRRVVLFLNHKPPPPHPAAPAPLEPPMPARTPPAPHAAQAFAKDRIADLEALALENRGRLLTAMIARNHRHAGPLHE